MYKRYYDGYGSFERQRQIPCGEVVIPKDCALDNEMPKECVCNDTCHESAPCITSHDECNTTHRNGLSSLLSSDGLFGNLSIDDIILFGVILLVLKDSADDPMLIIILAVIFISGFLDK